MTYPNLFAKYQPLKGKAWIKALPRDELQVFIDIGLQACEHGRLGGLAIAKRGREHMSKIGRIGAIVTNSKRLWNRLMIEEMEKEGLL